MGLRTWLTGGGSGASATASASGAGAPQGSGGDTQVARNRRSGSHEGRIGLERTIDGFVAALDSMAPASSEGGSSKHEIPVDLLRNAQGIAFTSFVRAGALIVGATAGYGCVIGRVEDSSERGWHWSCPSALISGGVGTGLALGIGKSRSITIFNDLASLDAFKSGRKLQLGAEKLASTNTPSTFTYALGKGVFVAIGASLQGVALIPREDENQRFYEDQLVTTKHVLDGHVEPRPQCKELERALRDLQGRLDARSTTPSAASEAASVSGRALAKQGLSRTTSSVAQSQAQAQDQTQAQAPPQPSFCFNFVCVLAAVITFDVLVRIIL